MPWVAASFCSPCLFVLSVFDPYHGVALPELATDTCFIFCQVCDVFCNFGSVTPGFPIIITEFPLYSCLF